MLVRTKDAPLHPLHRLWRLFPRETRRRVLANILAMIAPRPDRPPPLAQHGLAVAGELSRASGLGEGARLMLEAAQSLGLPVWAFDIDPLYPGDGAVSEVCSNGPPPPGAPLVLHVNAPMLPLAMLRMPRRLFHRRRVIAYWAWELPVVPDYWRAALSLVHEVWTPSSFSALALETLAPSRVRVVPHPLAFAPTSVAPNRAAFGLPADTVTVLTSFNLASSFERKNPLAAIVAFRAAFGDRPDRLLLLKVGNTDHFPSDLARLHEAVGVTGNIRIMTEPLPVEQSRTLIASADIVLSLHRSEGFGLVPAEAMLLGKPVVATGWSGNMDFMDDRCAALVPARLVPSRDPRGVLEVEGAVWAEPDIAVAAAHLKRLADDPAQRAELGARASKAAMTRLTAEPLANALRDLGLPVR